MVKNMSKPPLWVVSLASMVTGKAAPSVYPEM